MNYLFCSFQWHRCVLQLSGQWKSFGPNSSFPGDENKPKEVNEHSGVSQSVGKPRAELQALGLGPMSYPYIHLPLMVTLPLWGRSY